MNSSDRFCYLFTQSFPYGYDEPFIEPEIHELAGFFKQVIIFPLSKKIHRTDNCVLPGNVSAVYLFDRQNEGFNAVKSLKENFFLFSWLMLKEILQHPILTIRQIRNLTSDLLQQFYRAKILNEYLEKNKSLNEPVFYSYWFDRWALILSIAKKRAENKSFEFISRAHGYEIFKDQTEFGYHPFKSFMLSEVKKVYTVSKHGKKYLGSNFRSFSKKIDYAYLGVNQNPVNKLTDVKFHIASCAHVRSIKRLDKVCEILAEISNVEVKWTLIGDGEDLEMIKKKAADLPENIYPNFTGNLSSSEVLNYYNENTIHLFLSVSRSEGLPYTMMEAISFGIPVMSTDVGGCREIVTNKTGELIPRDFDPKKVADKIVEFMHSIKNTEGFRDGVKIFWEEHFNAKKNYSNFYEEILS